MRLSHRVLELDVLDSFLKRPWAIGILGVAVLAVAAWSQAKGIGFKTDILAKTTDLLASLLVITVFVERSLAIINDIWLGEERAKQERQVLLLEARLTAARTDIERAQAVRAEIAKRPIPATGAATAAAQSIAAIAQQAQTEMASLRTEAEQISASLDGATTALTSVEAKQDRSRLEFGFLFSLFISAVGVRTLDALLNVDAAGLSNHQAGAFRVADILLTAGLIAGGSSGINSIADLIGTYVEASRKRAAQR
jgi:hypothetical protein